MGSHVRWSNVLLFRFDSICIECGQKHHDHMSSSEWETNPNVKGPMFKTTACDAEMHLFVLFSCSTVLNFESMVAKQVPTGSIGGWKTGFPLVPLSSFRPCQEPSRVAGRHLRLHNLRLPVAQQVHIGNGWKSNSDISDEMRYVVSDLDSLAMKAMSRDQKNKIALRPSIAQRSNWTYPIWTLGRPILGQLQGSKHIRCTSLEPFQDCMSFFRFFPRSPRNWQICCKVQYLQTLIAIWVGWFPKKRCPDRDEV